MKPISQLLWITRPRKILVKMRAYCALVMIYIVLYVQILENDKSVLNRIDLFANFIVLGVTIIGCVLFRHIEKFDLEETGKPLELSVSPIWLLSAILYIGTVVVVRIHYGLE